MIITIMNVLKFIKLHMRILFQNPHFIIVLLLFYRNVRIEDERCKDALYSGSYAR